MKKFFLFLLIISNIHFQINCEISKKILYGLSLANACTIYCAHKSAQDLINCKEEDALKKLLDLCTDYKSKLFWNVFKYKNDKTKLKELANLVGIAEKNYLIYNHIPRVLLIQTLGYAFWDAFK